MPVSAIVLSAGEAARMRSNRPKPLHQICGRPMVLHVLHALEGLDLERTVVVVGDDAERVTKRVQESAPSWANVTFVEQRPHHGTADAALAGLAAFDSDDLDDTSTVVVLPGHVPLLRAETITTLVARHEASGYSATVLTTQRDEPTGYRRVVRGPSSKQGQGPVIRLVAARDASTDELAITECASSVYAFRRDLLMPALRKRNPETGLDDRSLSEVVEVLSAMGHRIGSVAVEDDNEVQRVDDRWQLAMAERELRARTNRTWLLNGVTMLDPRQTFIDVTVELGRDVTLFPGTILQGRTVIGSGCEIGPDTRLVDSVVGPDSRVQYTVGVEAEIGAGAEVGPFAHLAGSTVAEGETTGPFYTGHSE